MIKYSVRYFLNNKVRAVWDNQENKWWYSCTDIVLAIASSANPRIFWGALKRRHKELNTFCKQLKLYSKDGKKYLSDVIDEKGIRKLKYIIHNSLNAEFEKWINGDFDPIDEQSKNKAYQFYKTNLIEDNEIGKVIALQKIHAYLFEGLYDFAGKIRTKTISKGGFMFANGDYLPTILKNIDNMKDNTFDEIIKKYVEINIAHPFMEGNGRATRIWLDLLFINRLKKCVDWSKIDKNDYLTAMSVSYKDDSKITKLIKNALTDKINDRELFMKGIDTSYYYEEVE